MTIYEWNNELKPGMFVQYTGKDRDQVICLLTGDDFGTFDRNDPDRDPIHRGMALVDPNSIFEKGTPWRRTFRSNKYRKWKKLNVIMIY